PTSWSSVTSTNAAGAKSATVTVPATTSASLTGTYYLWIKAGTLSDVSGNTSNQVVSALFKFDNTNPTVSVSTSKTTKSITAVATASATSGISKYEFSKDNGTTWINNGTNKTYTFTGLTHNTSYNIKVRVTSGVSRQNTSAVTATTTNIIPTPTYSSTNNGEVVISYPSGCGSTYTCTYIKDGGSPVTVTSNPTIYFGANGTLVAKVSDGVSTVSASTYSVVRNDLYVSSSGNDTTGYGTLTKPYATIQKAYNSANTTATIKIMTSITQTTTINMNASKNITLQSYSTTGTINSIIKGSVLTSYVVNQTTGTLNLKNITIDGNNIQSKDAMIRVASKMNMENGTLITKAIDTDDNGGAIFIDGGILVMNDGAITHNSSLAGGGAAVYICGNWTNESEGTFIMNGGTINHNGVDNASGGAIYNGGVLTISNGDISYNVNSIGNGGAILSHTKVTITGSTINYNKTFMSGGAISKTRGSDLIISNSDISNNVASQYGGAVAVYPDASNASVIDISGSTTIKNNMATNGGGIFVSNDSGNITLNIKGGTISGNKATTSSGGGIYAYGIVNMSAGTISGNTAYTFGGGLMCKTMCTMTGGIISGNTATNNNGGGARVDGTFTLNGGIIRTNTAKADGGISVASGATYNFKKGTVTGNKPTNLYETG
ncbi:MAG: beta strand repeat-containing protein, partial [Oscillospiraceae bacterium]